MIKTRVTISILTMLLVAITFAIINVSLGDFEELRNTVFWVYFLISALTFISFLIGTFETLDIYDNEFHILFLIAFFGVFAFIYHEAINNLYTWYRIKNERNRRIGNEVLKTLMSDGEIDPLDFYYKFNNYTIEEIGDSLKYYIRKYKLRSRFCEKKGRSLYRRRDK